MLRCAAATATLSHRIVYLPASLLANNRSPNFSRAILTPTTMSETVSTAAAAPQPNTATTRTAEKPTVDQGEAAASTVSPPSEAGASSARGRGRGRGRWYRRGRGRGRGRGGTPRPAQEQDREDNDAKEGDSSGTPTTAAVPPERKEKAPDVDGTEAGPDAGPSGPSDGATAQRRPRKWTERPPKVRLTHCKYMQPSSSMHANGFPCSYRSPSGEHRSGVPPVIRYSLTTDARVTTQPSARR